jgi:hypothetical protein
LINDISEELISRAQEKFGVVGSVSLSDLKQEVDDFVNEMEKELEADPRILEAHL